MIYCIGPLQCLKAIDSSLVAARNLLNDVDLHVMMHDAYGKGFIKRCNVSPDAFIQMALQLAYYRVGSEFIVARADYPHHVLDV